MKKADFVHPYIATSESYKVNQTLTVPFMQWLLDNHHPINRDASDSRVEAVRDDIRNKRWKSDVGTLLAINRKGHVIDGQHRLLAFIAENKPMTCTVQYGLPLYAIKYKDTARPRRAADNALFSKAAETNILPSDDERKRTNVMYRIARWVVTGIKWKNGERNARAKQSDAAYAAAIEEHSAAIEFAMDGATSKHTKRPGYASALAMYYMKHPLKALKFREQMTKGTGACEQVVALRDYLLSAAGGGNSPIYDHHNTVNVINAFHNNKPIEGRLGACMKSSWNV